MALCRTGSPIPKPQNIYRMFNRLTSQHFKCEGPPGFPRGPAPTGYFQSNLKTTIHIPSRLAKVQFAWPTVHLSGIPRDAMETTFNGGRPLGIMRQRADNCNGSIGLPRMCPPPSPILDCAGRAQRRRRFRTAKDVQTCVRTEKRCRASLATALQDAARRTFSFQVSAFQLFPK